MNPESKLSDVKTQKNSKLLNPFPGLRPFEQSDLAYFFGRDKQVEELANKLRKSRFLAVLGKSGSGKSSIVKCGLIPLMEQRALANGVPIQILAVKPGSDPVGSLAIALANRIEKDLDDKPETNLNKSLAETLNSTSEGLIEIHEQYYGGQNQEPGFFLIYIDQFEELFTQASEQPEVVLENYANLLVTATNLSTRVYVVISMRDDFIDNSKAFPKLLGAIQDNTYHVRPLTPEERNEAIQGPIYQGVQDLYKQIIGDDRRINESRYNWNLLIPNIVRLIGAIDKDLKKIGKDSEEKSSKSTSVALPVLQHALMRTWDNWLKSEKFERWKKYPTDSDFFLDVKNYDDIGRLEGAIEKHIEEIQRESFSRDVSEIYNDDYRIARIQKVIFQAITQKGKDEDFGISQPKSLKDLTELADEAERQALTLYLLENIPELNPRYAYINDAKKINLKPKNRLEKWFKRSKSDELKVAEYKRDKVLIYKDLLLKFKKIEQKRLYEFRKKIAIYLEESSEDSQKEKGIDLLKELPFSTSIKEVILLIEEIDKVKASSASETSKLSFQEVLKRILAAKGSMSLSTQIETIWWALLLHPGLVTKEEVADILEHYRKRKNGFIIPFINDEKEKTTPNEYTFYSTNTDPDNEKYSLVHESLMRQWAALSKWVQKESDAADIYRRLNEARIKHAEKHTFLQGQELIASQELRDQHWANRVWAKKRYDNDKTDFDEAMLFLAESEVANLSKDAKEKRRDYTDLRKARQNLGWSILGVIILLLLSSGIIYSQYAKIDTQKRLIEKEGELKDKEALLSGKQKEIDSLDNMFFKKEKELEKAGKEISESRRKEDSVRNEIDKVLKDLEGVKDSAKIADTLIKRQTKFLDSLKRQTIFDERTRNIVFAEKIAAYSLELNSPREIVPGALQAYIFNEIHRFDSLGVWGDEYNELIYNSLRNASNHLINTENPNYGLNTFNNNNETVKGRKIWLGSNKIYIVNENGINIFKNWANQELAAPLAIIKPPIFSFKKLDKENIQITGSKKWVLVGSAKSKSYLIIDRNSDKQYKILGNQAMLSAISFGEEAFLFSNYDGLFELTINPQNPQISKVRELKSQGFRFLTTDPEQKIIAGITADREKIPDDGQIMIMGLDNSLKELAIETLNLEDVNAISIHYSMIGFGLASGEIKIFNYNYHQNKIEILSRGRLSSHSKSIGRRHEYAVASLRFSPDGKQLASIDSKGTTYLWTSGNYGTEAEPIWHSHTNKYFQVNPILLTSSTDKVDQSTNPNISVQRFNHIQFSSSGEFLVGQYEDGSLYKWHTTPHLLMKHLCENIDLKSYNWTKETWEKYRPGLNSIEVNNDKNEDKQTTSLFSLVEVDSLHKKLFECKLIQDETTEGE